MRRIMRAAVPHWYRDASGAVWGTAATNGCSSDSRTSERSASPTDFDMGYVIRPVGSRMSGCGRGNTGSVELDIVEDMMVKK